MYAKAPLASARLLVVAASVVCTLSAGNLAAKDKIVAVVIHVSTQGLDLTQPGDARKLYTRLENAAWGACTRGTRVDLLPVDHLQGCVAQSLGDAIRSVNAATLTRIYLETHTLTEAATHGIEVPAQVAAK